MYVQNHLHYRKFIFFAALFAFFITTMPVHSEGEEYLAFAEVMPEPIGGMSAIISKVVYPQIAKSAGIQGKVYLLAFIDESGNVTDVKVIRGIGGGCDEVAVEAVKKTDFNPGKNKGVAVKVKLSLPIEFKLR